MATASLHRIFVYGTLKRGQPNHHRLVESSNGVSKCLGAARLLKKYPLVVAGRYSVPFLLDKEGEGKEVYGELLEVDDKMLNFLDQLEQHPHFYRRMVTSCVVDQTDFNTTETVVESAIACEVYLMPNFNPELLALPHHSSYSDDPERPYICPEDRAGDPSHEWWQEIKAKQ